MKYYNEDPTIEQLFRLDNDDAGYDICTLNDIEIKARHHSIVDTGLHVAIPKGYVGLVKSRSGHAFKHRIEVGAGVIDSNYRGAIKVLLYNHSYNDVSFSRGDRIAQLCVVKLLDDPFLERVSSLEELGETTRGEKGFGSSGK